MYQTYIISEIFNFQIYCALKISVMITVIALLTSTSLFAIARKVSLTLKALTYFLFMETKVGFFNLKSS